MHGAYRILLFDIDGTVVSTGGAGAAAWVFGLITFASTAHVVARHSVLGSRQLPSLGVVLLGLSVLIGDVALALAGLVTGVAGVALTTFLGDLAARAVGELF